MNFNHKYVILCHGVVIASTNRRAIAEQMWQAQRKDGTEATLHINGVRADKVPTPPKGRYLATRDGVVPAPAGSMGYAYDKAERFYEDHFAPKTVEAIPR